MKISTKGRYGLRAMVDIASHFDGKCVTIKSISERQEISENYLEQIIAPLKKAGFLKSVRGAQGGYFLEVPAEKISVGDILRTMEGGLQVAECCNLEDHEIDNKTCRNCVTKKVWGKLYDSINEVVDSIMLSDLVNDYKLLSETDKYLGILE